jgi:serine/threonine protein kinase/tetratricopeptide (TPR) repeat protein/energy-coupling factor transporter ATP-binding protein EcfA2
LLNDSGDDFAGNDRFQVIRRIGAGGMGVVYEALDRERNAVVALKTLRSFKPDALLRFKNEFRALADIQHPNLATLGELHEDHERWFFTMEMVHGVHFLDYIRRVDEVKDGDVASAPASSPTGVADQATVEVSRSEDREPITRRHLPRVRVGKLASGADEARLRSAFAQLALGLAALHRARKVHRDIKPSNILVTREGRVVVLDFGLVADLLNLAPESHLVGTFSYMAPEQAGLKQIGPAADWYSVGVLLYQALTGRLPVTGAAREVLVLKQAFEPAAPHVLADVPDDLDALAMDLLRIDPARRPPEAEILARLHADDAALRAGPRHGDHFVGRRMELDAVRKAFSMTRKDRGVCFLVHGESGVGKSALIRHALDGLLAEDPGTVILAGRCYERESVPYKAVDGIIDALSRFLTSLPEGELSAVLPRQRGLVGQVFPVMRRIEAVAQAPRPEPGALDPLVLRARLFFALRDLFTRLADLRPVVLAIDDLQWADADSLALLADVMRHPGAPRLLLVATMRTALQSETSAAEARGEALAMRTIDEVAGALSGDVRRLSIEALPPADARALVDALLHDAGADAEALAESVAAEAGGHPLFIDELVRHRLVAGEQAGPLRLTEALRSRIARLDAGARQLLELCAVAGAPLRQETAAAAAKVDFAELSRRIAVLRAGNLMRTAGARRTDTIEAYHDRVREAALLGLDAEGEKAAHMRLALALEASPDADAEALAAHWLGAGDADKAATYATWAAGQAAEALAFDRAARLYQLALDLKPREGDDGAHLRAKLGDALANAGRGAEAAAAYLAAADALNPAEALDLRRRAADQLLRSGHIDEAMATFRVVLSAVGMDMPDSARAALAAFLFRRAQVRLRGLDFREREEREIPQEDLTRIDTCWSAAVGLALVNTILGQYFRARCLLLALDAGEPHRVQRALGMEAAYSSADGGKNQKRTAEILGMTQSMARRLDHPYAIGWAQASEAAAGTLEGRWKVGYRASEEAEATFRDRCTGVTWELATMRWFSLWSLSYLGGLAELSRRIPARLHEARERGDLYAVICHATGLANLVWLAEDDPETARARSREALARWSRKTFHVEHWWAMLADRQSDLYAGDVEVAYQRVNEQWRQLDDSLLLMVQLTRLEATHLRARAALALARQKPSQRKALCRVAEQDAARILKEKMPWSDPLAALLQAGAAATQGDRGQCEVLLREAVVGLERGDMPLYAAAARWQRGRVLAGDEGRALVEQAERWMGEQGIANVARMAAMLAPGFEE